MRKYIFILVTLLGAGSFSGFTQEDVENNRLKLEVEPGLFFNGGRSILGMYNVTKDNNLGIGLYRFPFQMGK